MPEIGIQLQAGSVGEKLGFTGTTFEVLADIAQNYSGKRICESFSRCALSASPTFIVDPEKVRFTGYQVFGHGAYNVPELLLSINMFAREGVGRDQLSGMAHHMLVRMEPAFQYVHMIAKIYCGNTNGFSEIKRYH